jgi:preprotein translocase subunit SecB
LFCNKERGVESLSFEEIIIKSLEINCSSFPKLISEEEKEKIIEKTKMNIKKYKDKYWKKFEKISSF